MLAAAAADPAYQALDEAYRALRAKRYEEAVAQFTKAAAASPARASIRKDFGYTYLKIGETVLAREQFGEAMRLDGEDTHVALEYAFLCYETKKQAEARRVFDRLARGGDATAARAFRNIDGELAAGIARWSAAVAVAPDNFSGHVELARLYEQRDDLTGAARHFERAWQLRNDQPDLLVDLGRVWTAQGDAARAHAALLAASRGAQPRAAEAARELLPARYPFIYEFEAALAMDPRNVALRRELAFLHLAMGRKAAAETEFLRVVAADPEDLLSAAQLGFLLLGRNEIGAAMPLLERVLASDDNELADRVREALRMPRALKHRPDRRKVSIEAKEMALRSLERGFLKDALRYLQIAHENDPADFEVMLKLGWVHNMQKDDRAAVPWFALARRSPDPKVAAEARTAYENLHPLLARVRTSAWMFPLYSSRWQGLFSYGQVKTERRLGSTPLRAYVSLRFAGDTRGELRNGLSVGPVYLSEKAFIAGGGLATVPWRGLVAWGEAGESMAYRRTSGARMRPDYRGGLSFARGYGRLLPSRAAGLFFETTADAVFVSRFDNDTIVYSQNRTGYTFGSSAGALQVYWNTNATVDARRFHWANTVEQGPGVRFRLHSMPAPMYLTFDALDGRYTIRKDNPLGSRYRDFRAGIWYAFTR